MATSLKNIETLVSNIKDISKEMVYGAEKIIIPQILKNWDNSIGADGKKMKPLKSKEYADYKRKIGKQPIADMNLTGDMRGALDAASYRKNTTVIFFDSPTERKKASGNVDKRPGLMKLSDNKQGIVRSFSRWLTKQMMGK